MSDSLAPGFLIAVPQLLDPNFRQSVVLLLEQTDEGAMGLVINQESPMRLSELCEDHEIPYKGHPEKRVRRGGPVSPEQGIVLLGGGLTDPESKPVAGELKVSASRGTLTRLCGMKAGRFHCYSGYAGWGPGQLEREIREGSWIMAPVDPEMVFERPIEEVWSAALHANGIDPALLVPGGSEEA